MPNLIVEINPPKFNQQLVDLLTNEIPRMNTPHAQDNVSDSPRTEEPSNTTLSPQRNTNDQQTQTELYTKLNRSTSSRRTQKSPQKNDTEILHHHLAQQLRSLSLQVAQVRQMQSQRNPFRHPGLGRIQTRTCFRCHKRGHLAKDCRKYLRWNSY